MIAARLTSAIYIITATLTMTFLGCGSPAPTPEVDDPTGTVSFRDEGLVGNALTRTEVQTTLKLIDDICGDTWCEGDNDFRFRYLFCDREAESCTLLLQMGARTTAPDPIHWRWQTCRTSGFLGFDSLVTTGANGYPSLASPYYETLTDCIDRIE